MPKADEREMRRLLKVMAGLPKTEYKHSVILLYEMLAARNPEIAEKLATEQLATLLEGLPPAERERFLKLMEERLSVAKKA
jgi:hypothetical protein